MAYNLLGQQGPKGSRNPDPNLTDEQATYLYDTPPGQGDNKGVTAAGKPVDKANVQKKLAEVGVEDEAVTEEEVVETEDKETTKVTGRDDVRNAQTLLKNAGFDPGPIDGLIGPLTRGAANKYINAAKGQDELNKRRKEVGFIIDISVEDTTPTEEDIEEGIQKDDKGNIYLWDENGKRYTFTPDQPWQDYVDKGTLFISDPTDVQEGETSITETPDSDLPYVLSQGGGVTLYDKSGNPITNLGWAKAEEMLSTTPQIYFKRPPGNKPITGGKVWTLEEAINSLQNAPSTPADITNYELDKLTADLGYSNDAFDSAFQRAKAKIQDPSLIYGAEDFDELQFQILEGLVNAAGYNDNDLASRLGSILRVSALGLGVGSQLVKTLGEETFAYVVNSIGDAFSPDPGGVLDSFIDAAVGSPGANTASTWWQGVSGKWRYDTNQSKWVNLADGSTSTTEEMVSETKAEQTTPTTPSGSAGGAAQVDEGPLYWGRYDSGSWATSTLPGKPDGFKWAWELEEFPDKNQEQYISDKSIEEVLTLVGEPEKIELSEQTVTLYKRGESPITVPYWQVGEYLSRGWSTSEPPADSTGIIDVAGTDEVGPGQLVSSTLNEFNNVPQNSILIEAGGQLFLGYEVPGAYGQMYNGNPIFMLYEVLNNDVFEAGLLTQGATPKINVSLGSIQDLNQYGIIVGGTDELTDDVEHPFIRFTENFEAGKRVNPWLNDTEINPVTGVTYQQEAIEFLAEQALEQWTPEQTQVRYEGSDWYRKSTSAQKTWLTTLLTQPAQAQQDIQDKQIEVKAAMEANGIANPPDALINWVAEKAVTGMWTQVYTDQQIALLADPYKPGARDTGMVNFIEGVGVGTLDRLTVGEKTVRDLYRRYLGPSLGNASNEEIAQKAGQLRSDPDAEEQLKAYLEQQRLAMFGNYTNPTLTYNDIVQPYKNLVNQVWGQEVDETQDWFIKMVQDNDIEKAYKTLREKGIDQGIERVQNQALDDLQRSIGQGQIAPQLGANT